MAALAVLTTAALATSAAATTPAPPPPQGAVAPQVDARVGGSFTTTLTDLDDTRGRLDVASVRHRLVQVARHHVRVTYEVRTFRGFPDGLLDSPDRDIVFELRRTETRGADRNITLSSVDGDLVATVISNATREPIGQARVVRVDDRTIRVVAARELIGARAYFVTANYHDGSSRGCGWRGGWPVTCQDSVPDQGWVRVDRMGWPQTM